MNPFSLLSLSQTQNQKTVYSTHRAIINLRLRFSRNLARYPFPSSLSRHSSNDETSHKLALEIWQRLSDYIYLDSIFRQGEDNGGYRFYLPALKKRERIFLVERRIISPDMIKSTIPSGVVFTKDEKFIALINEEDHLRISVNDTSCPMERESSVEPLFDIVGRLDRHFGFAKDEVYGYLTSCPSNLGGGIRLSALFHLGALTLSRKIDETLDAVEKKGFYVRGYYGEKSKYFGDVFQISTIQSPQSKESFGRIYNLFLEVEKQELLARQNLLKEKRAADVIWRSWGALTTARMMSFAEAASALSMVMLGLDIGMDFPVKKEIVSRLMDECQPAHIEMIAGGDKPMSAAERDVFRADYIRKTLGAC